MHVYIYIYMHIYIQWGKTHWSLKGGIFYFLICYWCFWMMTSAKQEMQTHMQSFHLRRNVTETWWSSLLRLSSRREQVTPRPLRRLSSQCVDLDSAGRSLDPCDRVGPSGSAQTLHNEKERDTQLGFIRYWRIKLGQSDATVLQQTLLWWRWSSSPTWEEDL